VVLPKQALLSSCRSKIGRADEHLDALNREMNAWGDGDPFRIVRQGNANGTKHQFSLRYKTQPDVWRWSMLLGDAVHNLRSALDHIVYALAINQTRTDPPDDDLKLAFPIASDPGHFARSRWRIASLNDATQCAIERAQPYNRLNHGRVFQRLWWLAQLDDIDKHRLAHLTPLAAQPDKIEIDAEPGTFEAEWNHGTLKDGAPLLRLTLTKPNPLVQVNLHCTGSVVLEFEDTPPMSVYWTTRHIRTEVVVVCRYLSRFFI
jgi:hypothetical protein